MARITRYVLCVAVLFLLASCAAKKEMVVSVSEKEVSVPAPEKEGAAPAPEEKVTAPAIFAPSAEVEIVQLQVGESQGQVRLKVRIQDNELKSLDPTEIYLVDEATKRKYPVVRLQRIDALAEFSVPGEQGLRYIMFWNHDGGLKIGKVVTVNLGRHQQRLLVQ